MPIFISQLILSTDHADHGKSERMKPYVRQAEIMANTVVIRQILICYFLISNNHISDAWTFSGMTQRQAYGLGPNRNPDIVRPDDTFSQRQQRCRLWQATMFQDTSLSLYCEMPPGTAFHDIDPTCLRCHDSTIDSQLESPDSSSPLTELFISSVDETQVNDVAFLRVMWEYATWSRAKICIPRALRRAIGTDAAHKVQLIAGFREMYSNWAPPFNSYSESRFSVWRLSGLSARIMTTGGGVSLQRR